MIFVQTSSDHLIRLEVARFFSFKVHDVLQCTEHHLSEREREREREREIERLTMFTLQDGLETV